MSCFSSILEYFLKKSWFISHSGLWRVQVLYKLVRGGAKNVYQGGVVRAGGAGCLQLKFFEFVTGKRYLNLT